MQLLVFIKLLKVRKLKSMNYVLCFTDKPENKPLRTFCTILHTRISFLVVNELFSFVGSLKAKQKGYVNIG